MYKLLYQFNRMHLFSRLLIIVICAIFLFGMGIHFIEPETFLTIGDGVWWTVVTISTLGYGDFVPHSLSGRLFAGIVILGGAAFVTYYYTSMASYVIKQQTAYDLGKADYTEKNHIIIVGWNERSKQIINQLQNDTSPPKIVLIDESLRSQPKNEGTFFFIRNDPTADQTWKQANAEESRIVVLTADPDKNERASDLHVVTSLLALRGINKDVDCVCEILTPTQVPNALRAGANHIIESNLMIGQALLADVMKAYH